MPTFTRLFGDGKHGHLECIQTFRCQACRTTFTARRRTPLSRLKTPSHQIAVVLAALAEGLDPSAAERVFGYRQATITTWLTRAGGHAEILHQRCFHNLQIPHLQLDELRTRLRCATQVLWLWLAIDPLTKILPVLHLGPRTQNAAHMLIHSLRQLLSPGCLPLFTSDGLNLYFYASPSAIWTLARSGASWAESTPMAGSGGSDLKHDAVFAVSFITGFKEQSSRLRGKRIYWFAKKDTINIERWPYTDIPKSIDYLILISPFNMPPPV
jgi:hypothetical protein